MTDHYSPACVNSFQKLYGDYMSSKITLICRYRLADRYKHNRSLFTSMHADKSKTIQTDIDKRVTTIQMDESLLFTSMREESKTIQTDSDR